MPARPLILPRDTARDRSREGALPAGHTSSDRCSDAALQLALAIADEREPVLLIARDNGPAGWVASISEAIRRGLPFAVHVKDYILAADFDRADAEAAAGELVTRLQELGVSSLLVASGGRRRRHVFARIGDPALRQELAHLAGQLGGDVRRVIRPPLSPHRAGGSSLLLAPCSATGALAVLTGTHPGTSGPVRRQRHQPEAHGDGPGRRAAHQLAWPHDQPMSERMATVLRSGATDPFPSRSEAVFALALAAARAGWALDRFLSELDDPANAGGQPWRARSSGGRPHQLRWLQTYVWLPAVLRVGASTARAAGFTFEDFVASLDEFGEPSGLWRAQQARQPATARRQAEAAWKAANEGAPPRHSHAGGLDREPLAWLQAVERLISGRTAPYDRAVALALATATQRRVGDEFACSLRELQEATSHARGTVIRALRALQAMGLLLVVRAGGGRSRGEEERPEATLWRLVQPARARSSTTGGTPQPASGPNTFFPLGTDGRFALSARAIQAHDVLSAAGPMQLADLAAAVGISPRHLRVRRVRCLGPLAQLLDAGLVRRLPDGRYEAVAASPQAIEGALDRLDARPARARRGPASGALDRLCATHATQRERYVEWRHELRPLRRLRARQALQAWYTARGCHPRQAERIATTWAARAARSPVPRRGHGGPRAAQLPLFVVRGEGLCPAGQPASEGQAHGAAGLHSSSRVHHDPQAGPSDYATEEGHQNGVDSWAAASASSTP